MDKFWSSRLDGIEPYVPGEQPKDKQYIKLNTNENPYPPSPKAVAAIAAAAGADLRLYPDPNADSLRQTLATAYGVKPEQVFVGNGSDEVLAMAYLAFLDDKTPAVFPDVTYSFYPVYAQLFGNNCRIVPLREDFTMPLEDLCRNDGCVILTNPNAPTGIALSLAEVERIVRENPDQVVLVDEAYVDFGAESAVGLIDRYPNVLVVQTFSKSRSLAGLRIGFAFGDAGLITALNSVKNSFNSYTLDRLALAAAQAAVEDKAYFDQTRHQIMATRDRTAEQLRALGFTVLPSSSNFLFAGRGPKPAAELFRQLKDRGVLVRYFSKPRIDDFLRITVGTDAEMETLIKTLKELIG
jgi:histidinol-phosphate aminotransferase